MRTNPSQLLKSERKILDILSYGQSYSQKEIVKLTRMQVTTVRKAVNSLIEKEVVVKHTSFDDLRMISYRLSTDLKAGTADSE
jgi:DNA-binding MarR family transcriptional regulator